MEVGEDAKKLRTLCDASRDSVFCLNTFDFGFVIVSIILSYLFLLCL